MSDIDEKVVRHVADLAHLHLSDDEVAYYKTHIAKIIDYVAQLNSAEIAVEADWRGDVEGDCLKPRADEVGESVDVEEVMKQAPAPVGSAFQVPRIIE